MMHLLILGVVFSACTPVRGLLEPAITIPPRAQSISIATDGTVSHVLQGQTASIQAGQIQLANFQNPAGLNSIGTILQGYTEQSNVSVVDEFINLIVAQRTKILKASDEMYQEATR